MKTIAERTAMLRIKRSYDKEHTMARFFVTESATNYYVTIKICAYACPSTQDWKVSKKQANNMLHACKIIEQEAYERGNI